MAINIQSQSDNGYISAPKGGKVTEFMQFGDKVHRIHTVVVHQFRMGDVEDPDLYAAEPIWQWQQTEMGEWIMDRAVATPEWHRVSDHAAYGYKYAIVAKIKDIDYTFWTLKWGSK